MGFIATCKRHQWFLQWGCSDFVCMLQSVTGFLQVYVHTFFLGSWKIPIWRFPIHGGTPKSSILVGCSIPNHPAIGIPPIYGKIPHWSSIDICCWKISIHKPALINLHWYKPPLIWTSYKRWKWPFVAGKTTVYNRLTRWVSMCFQALNLHFDFKTAQAPIDSAKEAAKEVQSEGLTRLFSPRNVLEIWGWAKTYRWWVNLDEIPICRGGMNNRDEQ